MSDTYAFPKFIRLPTIERPFVMPVVRFDEVKSAADLPSRLGFGDVDPTHFQSEKKGWRAEWRSPDGGLTRFRYAGHLSSLELAWFGEEAVTLTTVESFADLALTMQGLNPAVWMTALDAHWSAVANVRVFPHREEDTVVAGFPDGYRVTLIMPVTADRLMSLFELHQRGQDDPAFAGPIEAFVRLHYSVVNYLEGRNPPILSHPAGLVLSHVNALGTPAAEAPLREVDPDGESAWTLRRSHYLYTAQISLRDVPQLLARLKAEDFIGPVGSAVELGAVLFPLGYEYAAHNAWWFDAMRNRRVFYPTLGDADDRNASAHHSGELWNKALVRDAQRLAEQCKADTVRAFVEGMSGEISVHAPDASIH